MRRDIIKAIIIGSFGLVTEALITRLKQEECELFVITSNKVNDSDKNKNIIEDYHFEYNNNNIFYIIDSIKADVVIFTGAFDETFTWKHQRDAVSYLSGIYNILISSSKAGVSKFIYLSTTDVYQPVDEGLIDESCPTDRTDLREMTIKNGEDIALRFHNSKQMQVDILRCSEVYGYHNNRINMQSFCTKICCEILSGVETISVDQRKSHDYIHISDLIDAIYSVITTETLPNRIYNICSGNKITEKLTVWMIGEVLGELPQVVDKGDSQVLHSEFSKELANREFDFHIKNSFEEAFILLIGQLKNLELQEPKKKKKGKLFLSFRRNVKAILGWLFPYIETVLLFAVIQIIISLTGEAGYLKVIDFYLLYVVFIAIIYGKGQTITALLLSFVSKIHILGHFSSLTTTVVDYNIYLWLLQLLIVGMGIGYIRDNYLQTIGDNEEEISYLKEELKEIKEISESNLRIKQIYENRLINYQDSFAKIYSIISKLDDLEPDKIVFAAVDVFSQIMRSNEIAIYNVDKGGAYARLSASSNNIRLSVKKSIQLATLGEAYEEIVNKKIYVNRSMNPDMPSMAGGVYHEDNLESIVIIKSLPFENMTLYHMNLFSVVLNLVTQALLRANFHINENRQNRYIEDTNILTAKAFLTVLDIKKSGSDANLADYCLLQVINDNLTLKQMNDLAGPTLRQKDYMGLGEDNKLYLLLANTNDSEAEYVMQRLSLKGIETRKDVIKVAGNKNNNEYRAS